MPFSSGDRTRQAKGRIIRCRPNPSATTVGYTEYQNLLGAGPSFFTDLQRDEICVSADFPVRFYHNSAKARTIIVANNYTTIYNFPAAPTKRTVFAVISLGGGLYGSVSKTTGILTGGDVQAYWKSIGITAVNQPTVVIVPIDNAKNTANVNDGGATEENSMDVETIGACCPGSNVIILFYIAPPTVAGFYDAFNSAINTPVLVNGTRVSPSVISCSWGAPEDAFTAAQLTRYNTLFASAVAKGINICVASGDSGSSDGEKGNHVDFPAASPNVIACGGTTLTCSSPTLPYGGTGTTEVAWSGSGGGVSAFFAAPSYQAGLGAKRAVPDIAMNADPNTGVNYLVGGTTYTFGGTSIVAPAMAAFVACSGISGFMNPHLYAIYKTPTIYGGCFHDITSGSNGSYSAKSGYDNCTGLGSLVGTQIKAHL